MIDNYKPTERKEVENCELVFDDGYNCGLAFPCDENGNLLPSVKENSTAMRNYNNAMQNPDRYVRFNKVIKHRRSYFEPASGDCHCGEHIDLIAFYMGACQCPKCGQWYNVFGQELYPPSDWEE